MSSLSLLKENRSRLFEVDGEDGVTYTVHPFIATMRNVELLWTNMSRHKVLFCDETEGDFKQFIQRMMNPYTIIAEVDDCGVFILESLVPHHSALAQYTFWDRKSATRHRVILKALDFAFRNFNLHRINIEIPRFAYSALHRAHKLGLRIEGIKREAMRRQGKWHDIFMFGITRDEISPETIRRCCLDRDTHEENWFGLLKNDTKLMKYVMR